MRLVDWQKLLNLHEGKAYQHVEVKSGEKWVPVGSNAQVHRFLYKSPENFRLRV